MKFLLLALAPITIAYGQTGIPRQYPLTAGHSRFSSAARRDVSAAVQSRVLPRIIAGDSWETTIVLFNPGDTVATFQQFFLGSDGTATSFLVRDQDGSNEMTTAAVKGVLAPKSSVAFVLSNAAGAQEGWSMLTYDASLPVNGYAILRCPAPRGGLSSEVSVPFSDMQDYSEYIRFDNTQGFRTQLTLTNPAGNIDAQVRLTYRNPQGVVVLVDSITVPAAQQTTLSLPDVYPDLANKTGTLLVEADIDTFSALGMRYNDSVRLIAPLPTIHRPQPQQ